MKILFTLLALGLAALFAPAATHTWNGSVNGYWSQPANWTPAGPPLDGEAVVFPVGAAHLINTNNLSGLQLVAMTFEVAATVYGNTLTIEKSVSGAQAIGSALVKCPVTLGDNLTASANTGLLEFTGAISLNGFDLRCRVDDTSGVVSILSNISGSGGMRKDGSGTLSMRGANTYTGRTLVNSGTLEVLFAGALGSTASGTELSGGTLFLDENVTITGESLTNSSALSRLTGPFHGLVNPGPVWAGNVVLNVDLEVFNEFDPIEPVTAILTLSGVVSGPAGLIKTGNGAVYLSGSGANTYQGDMRVNEGLLGLAKFPHGLPSVPGRLVIGGVPGLQAVARYFVQETVKRGITVNRGGLCDLNGFDETFGGIPMVDPVLVLNDGGDLQTGAGLLHLPINSIIAVNPGLSGSSTISGRLGLTAYFPGDNHVFNVGPASVLGQVPLTISATIETSVGEAELIKTGAGELRLTGDNTFSSPFMVNEGRLTLASPTALGGPNGVTVNSNAVLALDGGHNFSGGLLLLRSVSPLALDVMGGSNRWGSVIQLLKDTVVNVRSGATLTNYNVLSSQFYRLTKTGPGLLVLQGGAAHTNTTTVAEGTVILDRAASGETINGPLVIGDGVGGVDADVVRFGKPDQIEYDKPVTINASGLLDLNGYRAFIGSLAGDGHLVISGGVGLEVGFDHTSTMFDGLISGTGYLWKLGSGTMTLGGNNAYTGVTVIESGALLVNGSQPQSSVSIGNGATLGGSGVVGPITVRVGGTVAPGASAGLLTSGGVVFEPGAFLAIELNGTVPVTGHDQLNVLGTVNLGGAQLQVSPGFAPRVGDSFLILDNDGADAIASTFAGLPNGGTLTTAGGLSFRVSYTGGSGNDVTLTFTGGALDFAGHVLSMGNGNNLIEASECNLFHIVLSNTLPATVTAVQTALFSETPGITVTKHVSAYADLPAGSRRTNAVPFQLKSAPTFVCGTPVTLRLNVWLGGHFSFSIPIVLTNAVNEAAPVRFDNDMAALIPNPGTVTRTFAVSNIFAPVGHVEVSFFIPHRVDQDLDIFLVGPDGTRVTLTTDNGGNNSNYGTSCADAGRTRFSDLAALGIGGGTPPFVGAFRPEGAQLFNFSGKTGTNVNGLWTLEVTDDSPVQVGGIASTGAVNCASLFIYPLDCDGGGACELCPNTTIAGALGAGSLQQQAGLLTNGIISACGMAKTCPGPSPGPVSYEAHVFLNGPSNACITANLAASGPTLTCVIYTNHFNPMGPCPNYLADLGLTVTADAPSRSCSFNIGSNQTFVVVVSGGAGDYTLAVTGGDCAPRVSPPVVAGGNAVVEWSTALVGYQLEGTNRIPAGPGPWPPVTNPPVIVNGRYRVTTGTTGTSGTNNFFRLNKPAP